MRPKFLVLCIRLMCTAALLSACTAGPNSSTIPTVAEVVDGDTIVVAFSSQTTEQVRLLGIDTPETTDPTRPVQCFGAEATAHLSTLIPPGTQLRLERDTEARDRYGRLLAYVYRREDDLFVNIELLRNGFADLSIYEPNTAHTNELRSAVTSAQTQGAGLWGTCGGPDVPLDPN